MRKTIYLALGLTVLAAAADPPKLEGDWNGTLKPGDITLRLVLHISKAGDQLKANLDSPDQGATGLAVDMVEFKDGKLRFTMSAIEGAYEGQWNAEASEFRGTWTQRGGSLPLNLKRDAGAAASAASAPMPISAEERQFLLDHLAKTRREFLASIQGLTQAQWSYKEAGRWSIAECAEHIALSDGIILGLVTDRVLKTPAAGARMGREHDEKVIAMTLDRSRKGQAPEMLQPKGGFETPAKAVERFEQARAKTVEYARTTDADLRGHALPHPVLKTLDGYQWMLLLSAHSSRHTAQIAEVKASAGYPK